MNKQEYEAKRTTSMPEYHVWSDMKSRCYRKSNKSYKYYGGRGIIVCENWKNSFLSFLTDMGIRPTKNHSIDRINFNGNYEPNNCRWTTRSVQIHNRRLFNKKESKYRGVTKRPNGKFQANIAKDKIKYFLGTFNSEIEAAKAWNNKSRELYGDTAYQNTIKALAEWNSKHGGGK